MTACMQALASASETRITISDASPSSTVVDPTDATAQYQLRSDGTIWMTVTNNTVTQIGTWISAEALASLYEAVMTVNSGTLTSGTTGSAVSLGSNRTWTKQQTTIAGSPSLANTTVQIRLITTGAVKDTATLSWTASVES